MVQSQRQLPEALENGVALTLTEIKEDIPDLETIIPYQYDTFCDDCKQSTPFET